MDEHTTHYGEHSRREVCLPKVARLVRVVELELECLSDLVVLVVARKDDDGRVVPETGDRLLGLDRDAGDKLVVSRILAASKLEPSNKEDKVGRWRDSSWFGKLELTMKSCQTRRPSRSQCS